MNVWNYIWTDPSVCHGKPCFKGTRILVSTILELLESGSSYADIRKGYPPLTQKHIQAALHFAHQLLEQEALSAYYPKLHAASR